MLKCKNGLFILYFIHSVCMYAVKLPKTVPNYSDGNIWEESGYFEGDMVIDKHNIRNGLIDKSKQWPYGEVSYKVRESDFSKEELDIIEEALDYYQNQTCITFKKWSKRDRSWVLITGDQDGCYSSVGAGNGEQILNVNSPRCMHFGIVVHELCHALGFFHQQSSTERDDYIEIVWDNIKEGREHNFDKYDAATVTNFGFPYDYKSVMHYSEKAFSKNGMETIRPKKENVTLGQRDGLTETDIGKIQAMYKHECERRKTRPNVTEPGSHECSWNILNIL